MVLNVLICLQSIFEEFSQSTKKTRGETKYGAMFILSKKGEMLVLFTCPFLPRKNSVISSLKKNTAGVYQAKKKLKYYYAICIFEGRCFTFFFHQILWLDFFTSNSILIGLHNSFRWFASFCFGAIAWPASVMTLLFWLCYDGISLESSLERILLIWKPRNSNFSNWFARFLPSCSPPLSLINRARGNSQ